MRTFCIGDIHGAYKALVDVLNQVNFDYDKDRLISLGDICDGWDEVYECVEELLKIKNLITIKGNHDDWFLTWIREGNHPAGWRHKGIGTLSSYCRNLDKSWAHGYGSYETDLLPEHLSAEHYNFFTSQSSFRILDGILYVHGGFNRHLTLLENEDRDSFIFYWDRDLWHSALSHSEINKPFKIKDDFKHVYIGHTPTLNWFNRATGKPNTYPMTAANIITNLDTGAKYATGKLSLIDVNTRELYQSEIIKKYYD